MTDPLFDFNGDGNVDALEFTLSTLGDPDNPLYSSDDNDGSSDNCDDEE